MGFVTFRLAASALGQRYRSNGPGFRETAETVVLGPRPGTDPSPKPPVRIFLGTEPAQHRAERVFVWSVEQVRDPARTYEIHLMKRLAGFDRRLWLTGFTNYRFAIPHLAGGDGRAIYNDVDQIYLADPAEMFDLDMAEHGYLSISDADTSVMLIDCARMAAVWPLAAVKRERRKALESRARAVSGLWGRLAPEWNARDEEYSAGRSKCLHYTTLHTQPWQPFPEEYVYRPSPVADIWHALERAADDARFLPFTAEAPTRLYAERLQALRATPSPSAGDEREAAEPAGIETMDYAVGVPMTETADRVRCRPGTLEYLPEEDVPWTIDRLFRHAGRDVEIHLADKPGPIILANGRTLAPERRSAAWWQARVAEIASWYTGVSWTLTVGTRMFRGGRRRRDAPVVWVIASEKPGHTSQSIGLAQALGWPHEVKDVRLAPTDYVRPDIGDRLIARLGLDGATAAWPDVVIGSGWLAARTARLIRRRSSDRTRIVVLGRKGGPVRDAGEVGVALAHFGLPPNPRRIDAVLPPNQVTSARLEDAVRRWPDLLSGRAHPRVVFLVGGPSKFHRLPADTAAEMTREALAWTATTGGSLTMVTSRRTGEPAATAIRSSLGDRGHLHEWRPDDPANPYLGFLAQADILIVTGESESMLAEAVTAGKPVYIYPLPRRAPTRWQRLSAAVARRAETPRINKRGTPRPQQGLEYLCARLIQRGVMLPPRDIEAMHRNAVDLGVARFFGEPWQRWNRPAYDPTAEIAERVRTMLDAAPRSASGINGLHPAIAQP